LRDSCEEQHTVPVPPTILLVDDDLDLREAAAEALEDAGYKVVRADDGRRALDEMTRGLRPDLILLDMMMPNLDGWGFRVAQKQMPDIAGIPVVALTAYALTDDERDQLDAAAILRKPVALEDLMRAVDDVARPTA
jgi:two-component system, chemotaxis family, chemotaxis protein CheY